MSPIRTLLVCLLAAASLGWLDPLQHAREGNRLYADGKYDAAAAKYNDALVDHPDSSLLHFNLGDARYRQGKYADAVNAWQQVPATDDDPARTARVAYNLGNTKYRLGEAAAASDPKAALGLWAEALVAYRRALGAAPDDVDAKFNHEFVERKIAELKKKLEEQQKKKDEQKDQQKSQQDQKQQQDQGQQQDQAQQGQEGQQDQAQQNQDQKKEDQAQNQQGGGKDEAANSSQQQGQQAQGTQQQSGDQAAEAQSAAEAAGARAADGGMSRQEAGALLDAQRGDEVRPEDVVRRLQHGEVAEPAEDW